MIIFLIVLAIVRAKDCQCGDSLLSKLDPDCTTQDISNCIVQCTEPSIQQLVLTHFSIRDSTFVGCSQIEMAASAYGVLSNLTFISVANHQLEPPLGLFFYAPEMTINQSLSNWYPDQVCVFIAEAFIFDEMSDIICPNLVLHQTKNNLHLLPNLTATHQSCSAPSYAKPLISFIKINPSIQRNKYVTNAIISVDDVLRTIFGTTGDYQLLFQLHYLLASPRSTNNTQNYSLLVLVENGTFTIPKSTVMQGTKVGIFSKDLNVEGDILAPEGCKQSEGLGRGVSFYYTGAKCPGSGGSSAGQGGTGLSVGAVEDKSCYLLAEATKFMSQLHAYNGLGLAGAGSGGGLQLGPEAMSGQTQIGGSGGGCVKVDVQQTLNLTGRIIANGEDGYTNKTSGVYNGAGGGGSLVISAGRIVGNGTFSARGGDSDDEGYSGEGGGGLISIILFSLENVQLNPESDFEGTLIVSKGTRDLSRLNNTTVALQYLGTDGSTLLPGCPEGYELVRLTCVRCPAEKYSFLLSGQCFDCPGVPGKSSTPTDVQCLHNDCQQFSCDPLKFVTSFILKGEGVLTYILLFMVIVTGYIVRRVYRLKEAHVEQLPFDFESATKHMIITHIITDTLRKNPEFQLVDLMYHAHRVVMQGSNSYNYPWMLPPIPSEEISYLVDQEEWSKFTMRMNKLAEWKLWEQLLLMLVAVGYYPFYWLLLRHLKKRKYKRIKMYVQSSDIKLWKFLSPEEQVFIKLKISKSADYTLLYLDIFNYKNSDLKYFFLGCPFIMMLSGDGSYLRPYYLCESDPFLSCLYFAINKSSEHDQDDERYRIMENLVAHKKRMENSARMNKFLTKFNRYARTIDFGSPKACFCNSVRDLLALLKLWNEKFFEKRSIRLDLVVMQTPLDGNGNQTITLLENGQSAKFDVFMTEVHQRYTLKQILDVKFGMFIYDTEMDIQEIDDALNNQKISFFEQPRANSVMNIGEIEEDEEVNINDLKEQYISRTNIHKQHTTQSVVARQKQSQTFAVKRKQHRPVFQRLVYYTDFLRYKFFSHRITAYNKYTIILVQLVLTFMDTIFLPLFLIANIQELISDSSSFVDLQFLLWPFPFTLFVAPIIGCLWMSTQSYGIAKAHLIFNALSIFNLTINIVLRISQVGGQQSTIAIVILCVDLLVKLGITVSGKFILSINVKLNKLNQAKHIAGQ